MTVEVRRPEPGDRPAWMRFVDDVPRGEDRFLKEDLRDSAGFEQWTRDPGWLVAVSGDEIAGAVSVVPGQGWSSHVAEMRLVVGGSHRGRGIGGQLACRGLATALEQGCTYVYVYVEVVAEQEALISMFKGLGFRPEAILEDFVRDGAGEPHNLMLLTHHAAENWSALAGLGLTEAADR